MDCILTTAALPFTTQPRWPAQWMSFPIDVANLPKSTRITFAVKTGGRSVVAGAAMPMFDYRGHLVAGKRPINLWPHQDLQIARDPKLGKGENLPRHLNLISGSLTAAPPGEDGVLVVEFDSYSRPVYAKQVTLNEIYRKNKEEKQQKKSKPFEPSEEDKGRIQNWIDADPLVKLEDDMKNIIWNNRQWCTAEPSLVPLFLQSFDWTTPTIVNDAFKLLCSWKEPEKDDEVYSMELLLGKYSNSVVREYAVRQIDRMNDNTLKEFLLQIVQAIKFEPYHDSPLVRMILRRALRSPHKIGHTIFWLLRSEVHNPDISERFGVILETYLQHCGLHRTLLERECRVNTMLQKVAEECKEKPKATRLAWVQTEIEKLNQKLPRKFSICLDPRVECSALIPEKCKIMSSKKLPLWLCFKNEDPYGEPVLVLFKAGDDLRQDLMTLQLLRVMDKIWNKDDLDLKLIPYGCCATGDDLGMIQVVKNSNTTSNIQFEHGGGAMGAFKSTPIEKFLRVYNESDDKYNRARDRFLYSCAGYCVATYVLGIGDRHADNIMVTEDGNLFHIDFGHFLGNTKSKFGIKRERSPFVFTPEMAHVVRDKYAQFENTCMKAYNSLRKKTRLMISLFLLMVPAGMPELLEEMDIVFLQGRLVKDLSEEQAAEQFRAAIKLALNTISRQIDNYIHILKHK